MSTSTFIFKKWKTRFPVYVLKNLEKEKLEALELTWGRSRQYGVKAALTITFEAG